MTANIILNFNLLDNIDLQLDNLDLIIPKLALRGIHFSEKVSVSKIREQGPYERAYLVLSGKKRLRITNGETDREKAAKLLLENEYGQETVDSVDTTVVSTFQESDDAKDLF